jgi:hypothetical protein
VCMYVCVCVCVCMYVCMYVYMHACFAVKCLNRLGDWFQCYNAIGDLTTVFPIGNKTKMALL